MTITRQSAKRKGRNLEKLVVEALRATFPQVAEGITQVAASCSGSDIVLSEDAARVFPYSIECKARAGISLIYEALGQAERGNGREPVAVVKADRKRPLAVMDLDLFLRLTK